MSNPSHFEWVRQRRLDSVLATAGLVLAVALLPLGFLTSELLVTGVPVALGTACALYLWSTSGRDHTMNAVHTDFRLSARMGSRIWLLLPVVALGCAGMILTVALHGHRSGAFLGLSGLVGTLLLVHIAFAADQRLEHRRVLLLILVYATIIRFAGLFSTPGLIGIDTWTHITSYAAAIQAANSLSAISGIKYVTAPFYHLITVATAETLGLSLRNAAYLTIGTLVSLSVVAVYGAARYVVDVRWALFATVLFAVSEYIIEWGLIVATTSLGLALFLIVFSLVVRVLYTGGSKTEYGAILTLGVAITFSHQISTFVTAALFGVVAVTTTLTDWYTESPGLVDDNGWATNRALTGVFAFHSAVLLAVWAVTPWRGERFLFRAGALAQGWLITRVGFLNVVDESSRSVGDLTSPAVPTELVSLVNEAGLLLFLLVGVVGSLVVLRRDRLSRSVTLVGSFFVLSFVALGLPLFGFNFFNPTRWLAFMTAPMAVIGTLGIAYLSHRLSPRTAIGLLLVFALVFPGAMVAAEKSTVDQPTFEQHWPQYAYDQRELAAVETVQRTVPEGTVVYTDHPYYTVMERRDKPVSEWRTASGRSQSTLLPLRDSVKSDPRYSPTVYRAYQSEGRPIFGRSERNVVTQLDQDAVCPADRNHVYSAGSVRMCLTPTT